MLTLASSLELGSGVEFFCRIFLLEPESCRCGRHELQPRFCPRTRGGELWPPGCGEMGALVETEGFRLILQIFDLDASATDTWFPGKREVFGPCFAVLRNPCWLKLVAENAYARK